MERLATPPHFAASSLKSMVNSTGVLPTLVTLD